MNVINTFLKSSSFPTFIITFSYLGLAFRKNNRPSDIPYELFAIFLPLLFGIGGVINKYIIELTNQSNYSLLVGALFGLMLSSIGRFGYNLPVKIFDFNKENEHMVHLHAIILYSLIFRFIVYPISYF
jgi:hypothetical protein